MANVVPFRRVDETDAQFVMRLMEQQRRAALMLGLVWLAGLAAFGAFAVLISVGPGQGR